MDSRNAESILSQRFCLDVRTCDCWTLDNPQTLTVTPMTSDIYVLFHAIA